FPPGGAAAAAARARVASAVDRCGSAPRTSAGACSSIALSADHVHGAEGGHDIRDLVTLEQRVHAAHVHEARRADVQLVGTSAAIADQVEAELTVRRLVRHVDLASRHANAFHD